MNLTQKTALSLVFIAMLAGCGSSGNSAITADTDNVKRATLMRDLYTKSGGNYDSLTADEKAQFQKAIAPGMVVEKAWASLAPQKVTLGAPGDPRQ